MTTVSTICIVPCKDKKSLEKVSKENTKTKLTKKTNDEELTMNSRTSVINPITDMKIKIGSRTHIELVSKGIFERHTLDIDKVPIVDGSRQTMHLPKIQYTNKSTHIKNIKQIATDLHVSEFMLLDWFSKNFDEMKICYNLKETVIILPGREPFILTVIKDFIANLEKIDENKDITYWNQ